MAKYTKGAGKKVEEAMHEMKQGELEIGTSGKKVTSRKQAIAIGLSEARERGAKVPKKASKSSAGGRSKGAKKDSKSTSRTSNQGRKTSGRGTKKAAPRKSATKKTSG